MQGDDAQPLEDPLLSDEETSALLDAMRDDEGGASTARTTELGSPDHAIRESLGRADAAAELLAEAVRNQLLVQTARGSDVQALPAEVVPRDVFRSALDPHAVVYTLHLHGEPQGLL